MSRTERPMLLSRQCVLVDALQCMFIEWFLILLEVTFQIEVSKTISMHRKVVPSEETMRT